MDSNKLRKQLEKMDRSQLSEFIKNKTGVFIKDFESLTKEAIIKDILRQIEGIEFYEEKFS